jgi:sterol desaturase/sphingolipid hydroxylase (fatty acid hydroxylase superfamily)
MTGIELNENTVRILCFVSVFGLLAVAEWMSPRRKLAASKPQRWLSNLALIVINTLVIRLIAPMTIAGLALVAESRDWGLLNHLDLPLALAVFLGVILLDFVIYLQHVLFHALPFLWRLHRVHHADLDVDVTTGLRFHPIEIVISFGIKLTAVLLLGVPPLAVLIFEVLLNATSMFNHANIKLPGWLDRVVRLFLVTPDMHRIHHSADIHETNTNFGFNLPWWDYLLGTYVAEPKRPHEQMPLGLAEIRDEQAADRLGSILVLPFRSRPSDRGG